MSTKLLKHKFKSIIWGPRKVQMGLVSVVILGISENLVVHPSSCLPLCLFFKASSLQHMSTLMTKVSKPTFSQQTTGILRPGHPFVGIVALNWSLLFMVSETVVVTKPPGYPIVMECLMLKQEATPNIYIDKGLGCLVWGDVWFTSNRFSYQGKIFGMEMRTGVLCQQLVFLVRKCLASSTLISHN